MDFYFKSNNLYLREAPSNNYDITLIISIHNEDNIFPFVLAIMKPFSPRAMWNDEIENNIKNFIPAPNDEYLRTVIGKWMISKFKNEKINI